MRLIQRASRTGIFGHFARAGGSAAPDGARQYAIRRIWVYGVRALLALIGFGAIASGLRALDLAQWGLSAPALATLRPAERLTTGPAPLLAQFTAQISAAGTWRQLGHRLAVPDSLMLETLRCRDKTKYSPDLRELDQPAPTGADVQVWLVAGECDRARSNRAGGPSDSSPTR